MTLNLNHLINFSLIIVMGNINCKGCDCTSMLRQHEFSVNNKDVNFN